MLNERADIVIDVATPFQRVTIARIPDFGKCLFLDGDLQSAEKDQDLYHSLLVNPAFRYNPNIRKALILGGGERATAKKVLSHTSVESVNMVDIDEMLVNICAKHLPEWSGKIEDPRLNIFYQDGGEFVQKDSNKYDLIVWDLTDPHKWEDGKKTAATGLYKPQFLSSLGDHLSENGVLSVDYAHRNRNLMTQLLRNWKKVSSKSVYIPSFEEKWVFSLMVPFK